MVGGLGQGRGFVATGQGGEQNPARGSMWRGAGSEGRSSFPEVRFGGGVLRCGPQEMADGKWQMANGRWPIADRENPWKGLDDQVRPRVTPMNGCVNERWACRGAGEGRGSLTRRRGDSEVGEIWD